MIPYNDISGIIEWRIIIFLWKSLSYYIIFSFLKYVQQYWIYQHLFNSSWTKLRSLTCVYMVSHNGMTTSWLSWWWCPLFLVKYKTRTVIFEEKNKRLNSNICMPNQDQTITLYNLKDGQISRGDAPVDPPKIRGGYFLGGVSQPGRPC